MTTTDNTPNYNEQITLKEESHEGKFIADLFEEDGAFGEADCAGL